MSKYVGALDASAARNDASRKLPEGHDMQPRLVLALGLVAMSWAATAQTVTDGDTIKLAGTTYRLTEPKQDTGGCAIARH